MPSYLLYHAESGTVVSKISLSDASFLEYQDYPGYSFFPTDDDTEDTVWIDPTTSDIHPLIPHSFDQVRYYATDGEELSIPLVKPCWISINSGVPVFEPSGEFKATGQTGEKVGIKLVGRYHSLPTSIWWITIEEAREKAILVVDTKAEELRAVDQTPGAGQATTYLRKADSARAFLAGETLSEAQLARLQDEADRLSITLTEAAESLVAIADAWEARDAEIDRIRLNAKAAINEATSGLAINAIVDAIVWP